MRADAHGFNSPIDSAEEPLFSTNRSYPLILEKSLNFRSGVVGASESRAKKGAFGTSGIPGFNSFVDILMKRSTSLDNS
jgi:hypothetical protein